MAAFQSRSRPAKSLFLPLVPPRKFPPPEPLRLPDEMLRRLATDIALTATFPFQFDNAEARAGPLSSKEGFNSYIFEMRDDKDLVIKRSVKIVANTSGEEAQFELEYCFANALLVRLGQRYHGVKLPIYYHTLVDLVCQGFQNRDALQITTDSNGNYWLRLRGAEPYRENSFFKDVTIVCHNLGTLIRLIYAEHDEDIDDWYLYEWVSPHIKNLLLKESLATPVRFHKQATILSTFFKKFSKFLAKEPR